MPTLSFNKRARFDYEILEKFEAGLMLSGQEVKSVRDGKMTLNGAHVIVRDRAAWLIGAQIPRYPQAGPQPTYDPSRTRKLLLHRRELERLYGKLEQKGLTIVPISVYTSGAKIKIEIGIGRGKKQFEKRETIKKRDLDRDLRRTLDA